MDRFLFGLFFGMLVYAQEPNVTSHFEMPYDGSPVKTCSYLTHNCAIPGEYHLAEDYALGVNTPVYASADGVVKEAQLHSGYGGTVLIEHKLPTGEYVVTFYGHLFNSSLKVKDRINKKVLRGDLLGYVADNANNGGWSPHLHFGISRGRYGSIQLSCDGEWRYQGYSPNPCTHNEWYDPTDFIQDHTREFTETSEVGELEGSTQPPSGYTPVEFAQLFVDAMDAVDQNAVAFNNGGGAGVHLWGIDDEEEPDPLYVQDLKNEVTGDWYAAVYNEYTNSVEVLANEIRFAWLANYGYRLGAPIGEKQALTGNYVFGDALPDNTPITVWVFGNPNGARKTIVRDDNTLEYSVVDVGSIKLDGPMGYVWAVREYASGSFTDDDLFEVDATGFGEGWVKPGNYPSLVRKRPDGSVDISYAHTVRVGNHQEAVISPALIVQYRVTIETEPSNVEIWEGNTLLDATPFELFIDEGESRTLTAKMPGYYDKEFTVDWQDGQEVVVY